MIILSVVLLLALCVPTGCKAAGSKKIQENAFTTFTDSTGREVQVPKEIRRVVASGIYSQIVLLAICPDLLVANSFDEESAFEYIDRKYQELPMLGQIYGGKSDFNVEELIKADPDVVIDIGEGKDSIKEDMDELTEKTGIPFVHIECSISDADETYGMLGELLNRQKEAEKLSDYCRSTFDKMRKLADKVEKKKALYVTYYGSYGVIAKGSFHAECFDMMTDNVAVVEEISNKGTGNQVDFEQILLWNPDMIIVSNTNMQELLQDERFKTLEAVKNGNCYEIPVGPFNWFGNPPSVQRYLGMLWLADIFYPEAVDYDLYDETRKYFELFYHMDLSEETFEKITGNK